MRGTHSFGMCCYHFVQPHRFTYFAAQLNKWQWLIIDIDWGHITSTGNNVQKPIASLHCICFVRYAWTSNIGFSIIICSFTDSLITLNAQRWNRSCNFIEKYFSNEWQMEWHLSARIHSTLAISLLPTKCSTSSSICTSYQNNARALIVVQLQNGIHYGTSVDADSNTKTHLDLSCTESYNRGYYNNVDILD